MKIMLAVDGSPVSTRAARHVAKLAALMKQPPEITLFYADPPLLQSVALGLGVKGTAKYHADNAKHSLRSARSVLKRARLAFEEKTVAADAAPAIIRFAKSADLVVMGSHGRGAIKGLFMGSVTTKVIALTTTPVTVVR